MLYIILRSLAILIFKILFRFKVKGAEYIPKKGGFILASNHFSYLDPVALGVACPRQLSFMARHDLFCNPLFSWLISNLGAFPVKRGSADLSALKEAMQRIKKGNSLVLFPEGTRRFDRTSFEPHSGIGFLAIKLNVPVIPVVISGTDKALPKGSKFIRPRKVSVQFGKQIYIDKKQSYQDITQLIMANIRHSYERRD